jgi:hypothetical protein
VLGKSTGIYFQKKRHTRAGKNIVNIFFHIRKSPNELADSTNNLAKAIKSYD